MSYIVFQHTALGFEWLNTYGGDDLQEVIKGITTGDRRPSQHYMYYIYKKYQANTRAFGTEFDVYKFVVAVAGSCVECCHRDGHMYALTHRAYMCWLFSDDLFAVEESDDEDEENSEDSE